MSPADTTAWCGDWALRAAMALAKYAMPPAGASTGPVGPCTRCAMWGGSRLPCRSLKPMRVMSMWAGALPAAGAVDAMPLQPASHSGTAKAASALR